MLLNGVYYPDVKVIHKDKQDAYIKVNNTVFKVNNKYCKTQDKTKEVKAKQTEDMINIDVKEYISVLNTMLQNGYFVGVSDEISKDNIKNIKKSYKGYGEITLVLKNDVIDTISKAISDNYTLANIVVADNKEFDRTLSEVKRKGTRSRLLYEGEKSYIKNRWF